MTDLTEQWKNKKLELHKSYYCQNKKSEVCIATLMNDNTLYSQELGGNLNFEYWEVLAPVPSFQEWQELKEASDGLSNLADEERERLAEENQQLKDIISKMCMELVAPDDDMSNGLADYFNQDLILEIYEVLK